MVNKMNKNKAMRHSIFPSNAIKPLLVALLAALVPLGVQAATPDAGSILQEIKPARPALPSSGETGLKVEQKDRAKLPETAPFEVKRIEIVGHTLFDTATLHALVASVEGQQLPLARLEDAVARITEHYRSRGYPLARAVIPAQAGS
jgi:hemolysin activation/secretion protein